MNRLPTSSPSYSGQAIRRIESLCKALRCPPQRMDYLGNNADRLYRIAQEIEKSDGSKRVTFDAKPALKEIHRRIKSEILDRVTFPVYLTGSIKGRDYKINAELHVGAAIVIAEDIGSFFPSTTTAHVFDVWRHFFGFSDEVACLLTTLTTRNGELPQGAITSPYLANLVFWRDEPALHDRFAADGIVYSRFVDDVAASSKAPITPERKTEIIGAIFGLMLRSGYKPKRKKHELKTAGQQMTVTKLTVNQKPGLPNADRARIRAAVQHLECLAGQGIHSAELRREYASVSGRVNHLARFHPGEAARLKARLKMLHS
ncbi:MAG: RNA-directed DNA polymerase [Betaproteobacteria bacterium]|nr:RNA-directed DNA polymerase [Betaproteobacteria bacterium]